MTEGSWHNDVIKWDDSFLLQMMHDSCLAQSLGTTVIARICCLPG